MDEITAPRIEPLAENTDRDQYPSRKQATRKRESPGKSAPSPSIESDDTAEEIHRIDELA
jgi:hypothetical protein